MLASQLLDGGGSERQVRQLAVALNGPRFEVHLAFLRPNEERERELRSAGIKTLLVPLKSYFSIPSATKSALTLRRYLRTHNIQLLHTFDNPTSTFLVAAARLAGTRVLLASQRGHRRYDPPNARRLRRLVDRLADGIVVNAPALAEHLELDEGISKAKIRFCPNGLDTQRFNGEGRKYLPELEGASLVIGSVATHRPEKQLPFLVDSFAEMRRRRPGLKLVLVGSGSETAKIVERVEAHRLGADCLMISHTADTSPILKSIDIFLLTSTSEGQSNSLMEAMASGCAVVASNVEGTRDLVRDGFNGKLFEYMNQDDLVAEVLALADDAALRTQMATDSSEWVRSTMSVEASAARMTAIYDEYLASSTQKLRTGAF